MPVRSLRMSVSGLFDGSFQNGAYCWVLWRSLRSCDWDSGANEEGRLSTTDYGKAQNSRYANTNQHQNGARYVRLAKGYACVELQDPLRPSFFDGLM
jgi:hypothetical protein